jgi:hypothetical protein
MNRPILTILNSPQKTDFALCGIVTGIIFVSTIFFVTPADFPIKWDMSAYTHMAEKGLVGNEKLVAPFAYRPAIPTFAAIVSNLFKIDILSSFYLCAFVGCLLFYMATFCVAATHTKSIKLSLAVTVCFASYYGHIKFHAIQYAMLDIYSAAGLMALWIGIVQRKFFLVGTLSVLGLTIKEWFGIPLAISSVSLITIGVQKLDIASLFKAVFLFVAGIIMIVGIRWAIVPQNTIQFFDPLNRGNFLLELFKPLESELRLLNILFGVFIYSTPILLVATRKRISTVYHTIVDQNLGLISASYVFLVILLTTYGGTNIMVFVSYLAPVFVYVACLISLNINRTAEIMFAGLICILLNRLFVAVPDPELDISMYLDHFPPYSGRFNWDSVYRFVEVSIVIFLFRVCAREFRS